MWDEDENIQSSTCTTKESHERRSSILKPPKRRNPLQELDLHPNVKEEVQDKSIRKRRRVSFANGTQVKEFLELHTETETVTLWGSSYEQVEDHNFHSVEISQTSAQGEAVNEVDIEDTENINLPKFNEDHGTAFSAVVCKNMQMAHCTYSNDKYVSSNQVCLTQSFQIDDDEMEFTKPVDVEPIIFTSNKSSTRKTFDVIEQVQDLSQVTCAQSTSAALNDTPLDFSNKNRVYTRTCTNTDVPKVYQKVDKLSYSDGSVSMTSSSSKQPSNISHISNKAAYTTVLDLTTDSVRSDIKTTANVTQIFSKTNFDDNMDFTTPVGNPPVMFATNDNLLFNEKDYTEDMDLTSVVNTDSKQARDQVDKENVNSHGTNVIQINSNRSTAHNMDLTTPMVHTNRKSVDVTHIFNRTKMCNAIDLTTPMALTNNENVEVGRRCDVTNYGDDMDLTTPMVHASNKNLTDITHIFNKTNCGDDMDLTTPMAHASNKNIIDVTHIFNKTNYGDDMDLTMPMFSGNNKKQVPNASQLFNTTSCTDNMDLTVPTVDTDHKYMAHHTQLFNRTGYSDSMNLTAPIVSVNNTHSSNITQMFNKTGYTNDMDLTKLIANSSGNCASNVHQMINKTCFTDDMEFTTPMVNVERKCSSNTTEVLNKPCANDMDLTIPITNIERQHMSNVGQKYNKQHDGVKAATIVSITENTNPSIVVNVNGLDPKIQMIDCQSKPSCVPLFNENVDNISLTFPITSFEKNYLNAKQMGNMSEPVDMNNSSSITCSSNKSSRGAEVHNLTKVCNYKERPIVNSSDRNSSRVETNKQVDCGYTELGICGNFPSKKVIPNSKSTCASSESADNMKATVINSLGDNDSTTLQHLSIHGECNETNEINTNIRRNLYIPEMRQTVNTSGVTTTDNKFDQPDIMKPKTINAINKQSLVSTTNVKGNMSNVSLHQISRCSSFLNERDPSVNALQEQESKIQGSKSLECVGDFATTHTMLSKNNTLKKINNIDEVQYKGSNVQGWHPANEIDICNSSRVGSNVLHATFAVLSNETNNELICKENIEFASKTAENQTFAKSSFVEQMEVTNEIKSNDDIEISNVYNKETNCVENMDISTSSMMANSSAFQSIHKNMMLKPVDKGNVSKYNLQTSCLEEIKPSKSKIQDRTDMTNIHCPKTLKGANFSGMNLELSDSKIPGKTLCMETSSMGKQICSGISQQKKLTGLSFYSADMEMSIPVGGLCITTNELSTEDTIESNSNCPNKDNAINGSEFEESRRVIQDCNDNFKDTLQTSKGSNIPKKYMSNDTSTSFDSTDYTFNRCGVTSFNGQDDANQVSVNINSRSRNRKLITSDNVVMEESCNELVSVCVESDALLVDMRHKTSNTGSIAVPQIPSTNANDSVLEIDQSVMIVDDLSHTFDKGSTTTTNHNLLDSFKYFQRTNMNKCNQSSMNASSAVINKTKNSVHLSMSSYDVNLSTCSINSSYMEQNSALLNETSLMDEIDQKDSPDKIYNSEKILHDSQLSQEEVSINTSDQLKCNSSGNHQLKDYVENNKTHHEVALEVHPVSFTTTACQDMKVCSPNDSQFSEKGSTEGNLDHVSISLTQCADFDSSTEEIVQLKNDSRHGIEATGDKGSKCTIQGENMSTDTHENVTLVQNSLAGKSVFLSEEQNWSTNTANRTYLQIVSPISNMLNVTNKDIENVVRSVENSRILKRTSVGSKEDGTDALQEPVSSPKRSCEEYESDLSTYSGDLKYGGTNLESNSPPMIDVPVKDSHEQHREENRLKCYSNRLEDAETHLLSKSEYCSQSILQHQSCEDPGSCNTTNAPVQGHHILSSESDVSTNKRADTIQDVKYKLTAVESSTRSWFVKELYENLWIFTFLDNTLELHVLLDIAQLCVEDAENKAVLDVNIKSLNGDVPPITAFAHNLIFLELPPQKLKSLCKNVKEIPNLLDSINSYTKQLSVLLKDLAFCQGAYDAQIKDNWLSFDIPSYELHTWFIVKIDLNTWENILPSSVQVKTLLGKVDENYLKQLVVYSARRPHVVRSYVIDVHEYIKTLELYALRQSSN